MTLIQKGQDLKLAIEKLEMVRETYGREICEKLDYKILSELSIIGSLLDGVNM